MKKLLFAVVAVMSLFCSAQTTKDTVAAARPGGVGVFKVRIVEMMLYNTFGGKDYHNGVFLTSPAEEFPLKWQYQFLDVSLPNPKYGDRSEFQDEDRFFSKAEDAASSLISQQ